MKHRNFASCLVWTSSCFFRLGFYRSFLALVRCHVVPRSCSFVNPRFLWVTVYLRRVSFPKDTSDLPACSVHVFLNFSCPRLSSCVTHFWSIWCLLSEVLFLSLDERQTNYKIVLNQSENLSIKTGCCCLYSWIMELDDPSGLKTQFLK